MRNAFVSELFDLAVKDKQIVLLMGDIGNRMFNRYRETFPERFFNCGIAEANMIGVAAGMALSGLRPVLYTTAPFLTSRCFEQIKIDLCYHHLPVILAGLGGGLSYAGMGATHHSFEDIAILRTLPGMTVVCPADAAEVRLALREALTEASQRDGPVYLRLGKKGEPAVHQSALDFAIGRGIELRAGEDVCLLGTGNILPEVLGAAEILSDRGVSARVVSMHTVKPLDEALLSDAFSRFRLVVTVEEHSLIGGFGAAVAERLADRPCGGESAPRLLRLGMRDAFFGCAGDQRYAREHFGLSAAQIAEAVEPLLR